MKLNATAFLMLLALSCTSFASEIYRYIDKNGHVSFSDQARHDGYIPLVKTWKGWKPLAPPANLYARIYEYSPLIESVASRYQISPSLIKAVIHAESHFDPLALSSKGAMGLMQLMPGTAKQYYVVNRQDPQQNVEGGTRYLKDLLKMFNNDVRLSVAAYNAGQNAVKRRGNKIPPYPETQRYVKKVLALYESYQNESNKAQLAQN